MTKKNLSTGATYEDVEKLIMAKKKQGKIDWKVLCTALICISGLEIYALSQGINGIILTSVLMLIAGIAGVTIPKPKFIK